MTLRRHAGTSVLLACFAAVSCGDGGSTGDPGVTDHMSLDPPEPPRAPPQGQCGDRPETAVPRATSDSGLRAIAPTEGLWFDLHHSDGTLRARFFTRRITLADPSSPAPQSGRTPTPGKI